MNCPNCNSKLDLRKLNYTTYDIDSSTMHVHKNETNYQCVCGTNVKLPKDKLNYENKIERFYI